MAKNIKEVMINYADKRSELYKQESDHHATKANLDQALAEIKRIIEEAKPVDGVMGGEIQRIRNGGRNKAIEQYHTNLLKALGE